MGAQILSMSFVTKCGFIISFLLEAFVFGAGPRSALAVGLGLGFVIDTCVSHPVTVLLALGEAAKVGQNVASHLHTEFRRASRRHSARHDNEPRGPQQMPELLNGVDVSIASLHQGREAEQAIHHPGPSHRKQQHLHELLLMQPAYHVSLQDLFAARLSNPQTLSQ